MQASSGSLESEVEACRLNSSQQNPMKVDAVDAAALESFLK